MTLRVLLQTSLACAVLLLALAGPGRLGLASSPAGLAGSERAHTLVIARTGKLPALQQPALQEVVDHIVRNLDGTSVEHGLAIVTSSNAELLKLLRQGRVDLVPDTLFASLLFRELGRTEILLREWRDGVPTYTSLFVVRADSPIRSLDDLRGRRVAFEDDGSTSAFRLPMALLRRAGVPVVRLIDRGAAVPEGAAGYLFAGGEGRIVDWVASGIVDAGAISSIDWTDPQVTPAPLRGRLRIIAMSDPIVRSVLSVRGGMDPALRDEIRRVLLAMSDTPEGSDILRRCLGVTRYDEFVGQAADELERSIELLLPTLDETR